MGANLPKIESWSVFLSFRRTQHGENSNNSNRRSIQQGLTAMSMSKQKRLNLTFALLECSSSRIAASQPPSSLQYCSRALRTRKTKHAKSGGHFNALAGLIASDEFLLDKFIFSSGVSRMCRLFWPPKGRYRSFQRPKNEPSSSAQKATRKVS